jgi:hypothetical protein
VLTATTIKFPEVTFDVNARAKEAPPVAVTLLCCTTAMVLGTTASTVKLIPLLATPDTVTTTLPVVAPAGTGATMLVALQLVGVAAVPLNVTVLVPWVVPKLAPATVTDVPTAAEVGDKLLMLGAATTVKLIPLLAALDTVTTTLPVVAPAGTGATMLVALQLVGVAGVPLNVTLLVPWEAPKLVPAMVTAFPTGPDVGFKLVMLGGALTVKFTPLLGMPATVTTMLPVIAPAGTGTAMLVALQLVGVAAVPLNMTVLVPCVAPRFAPAIVTAAPTGPEAGFKLLMLGGTATVNATPLLARLPTITTTFPVAAPAGTGAMIVVVFQLVGVAAMPLNVTALVPCVAPKFAPVIVIGIPTGPDAGFRLVMLGGTATVKFEPLLVTLPTVTTTLPVVAPAGTGTVMLVAVHAVGVPVVPLNVTVLVP